MVTIDSDFRFVFKIGMNTKVWKCRQCFCLVMDRDRRDHRKTHGPLFQRVRGTLSAPLLLSPDIVFADGVDLPDKEVPLTYLDKRIGTAKMKEDGTVEMQIDLTIPEGTTIVKLLGEGFRSTNLEQLIEEATNPDLSITEREPNGG